MAAAGCEIQGFIQRADSIPDRPLEATTVGTEAARRLNVEMFS